MNSSTEAPKVFISYSWVPTSNKERTLSLAERLTNDGIHVILDVWDLAEGHDKYAFMEKMVNDPNIKKVLIICNKQYAEKANSRTGGVGTETIIVSSEIYAKVDQTKFVPIIFERGNDGKPYVPTFIDSRIYVDLSSSDSYENEYDRLLRNIYDRPTVRRPPIGTPPTYLFEDEPLFLSTAHKVSAIKNALINERKSSQVLINDYYEAFVKSLSLFEIDIKNVEAKEIDEAVLQKIELMTPLRNDMVQFFETLFTYSFDFDQDRFHGFYEKLFEFAIFKETTGIPSNRIGYLKDDQFRFFFYEAFLYMCTIMLAKEKYKELGVLLHSNYLVSHPTSNVIQPYSYTVLQNNVSSLDDIRNKKLQMNRISLTADLVKQRADRQGYSFDRMMECDVLLYYISIMRGAEMRAGGMSDFEITYWWPLTSAHRVTRLPLFDRLISKRNFEKFKAVIRVETVDDLKTKIQQVVETNSDRIPRHDFRFPPIQNVFNFSKIGIID